jgi:hypothetical protein
MNVLYSFQMYIVFFLAGAASRDELFCSKRYMVTRLKSGGDGFGCVPHSTT